MILKARTTLQHFPTFGNISQHLATFPNIWKHFPTFCATQNVHQHCFDKMNIKNASPLLPPVKKTKKQEASNNNTIRKTSPFVNTTCRQKLRQKFAIQRTRRNKNHLHNNIQHAKTMYQLTPTTTTLRAQHQHQKNISFGAFMSVFGHAVS